MKTKEAVSAACGNGKCVHVVGIPGNCHIGCGNPAAVPARKTWPGCGIFPLNFDANTVTECAGYSENPADKRATGDSPALAMLRILAPRL